MCGGDYMHPAVQLFGMAILVAYIILLAATGIAAISKKLTVSGWLGLALSTLLLVGVAYVSWISRYECTP